MFHCVSIPVFVQLFENILNEKKIILVSSCLNLLTITAEALRILMYPFSWQYVYVSLSHKAMADRVLMSLGANFAEKIVDIP